MKPDVIFLLGLTLLKITTPTKSAKIIGIFPMLSKSTHAFNERIVKGLAAKGHNLTIISHFKSKDMVPNYREILFQDSSKGLNLVDSVSAQAKDNFTTISKFVRYRFAMEKTQCEEVLSQDHINVLIDPSASEEKIDLIMAQESHMRCYHLLAHKLNVPLILLSALTPHKGLEDFVGNPFNPSVTPVVISTSPPKMNFWQRLLNFFQFVVLYWYQNYKANENMEVYARRVFKMELPSDEELNRRTALAFYNTHFSFNSRAKSSNIIELGGVHIEESKPLPKDIEDFIKGSPHGVIFFSFGSAVKASSIPSEKLKIIADTFSSIPQRILWRVDKLNVTKVSANVKLGTWFPQRDILEHENVIAFISQCGIMGTFEAMHTSTPIIAIPLIFDQFRNANILVEKNVAVYVDYFTMDKNTFTNAITEITMNTKYRDNMQVLSKAFKDRPMSPLDEAVYWTEYILKHKGAPHLRTAGADMPLYQYLLLDVIVFVLGIISGLVYVFSRVFKIIISFTCQQKRRKIKTK